MRHYLLFGLSCLSLLAACNLIAPLEGRGDRDAGDDLFALDLVSADVEPDRDLHAADLTGDLVLAPDTGADLGPAPAFCTPPYLVCQDFDSSIGGWQPTDETSVAGYIDATPQLWGGTYNEYWTPDLGGGDRALTFYRSSSTQIARWALTLTNTTGAPITGLKITYDLECPWVRFTSADPRSARVAWFFETNGSWGYSFAMSPVVTNSAVTAASEQRWLSSGEMDGLGLRKPQQSASLTGLAIAPGQSFRLAFGQIGQGSAADEKNMNVGIDNLEISGQ